MNYRAYLAGYMSKESEDWLKTGLKGYTKKNVNTVESGLAAAEAAAVQDSYPNMDYKAALDKFRRDNPKFEGATYWEDADAASGNSAKYKGKVDVTPEAKEWEQLRAPITRADLLRFSQQVANNRKYKKYSPSWKSLQVK